MIIRVLSVKIAQGRGAEFHAFIREQGLPRIQVHPGLVSVHVGRRTDGHDEYAIVVTTWTDWNDLTEALGDPSQPYVLTTDSPLVETATVAHYEGIDLPPMPKLEPAAARDAAGDAPRLVAPPLNP